jgi:hypothetical protein
MAQPAQLYKTSNMNGIKEDVDDAIYNLDPKDTPFLSTLPAGEKLTNRQFSWQEDSYGAANKDNARIEGDDFVGNARTPTFFLAQHVQTFTEDIVVSGLSNAVSKYGRGSESDYQDQKASVKLKKDIEAAFLSNNIAVAATGAVAHKQAGLELYATVNAQHGSGGSTAALTNGALPTVAPTDGTTPRALTETIWKNALRAGWQSGLKPMYSFQTLSQKAAIDGFVGAASKQVTTAPKEMLATPGVVAIYMWEEGPIAHINVYDDRLRSRTLFITDGKSLKRRTLRPISRKPMGSTGDNTKEMLLTDTCIQVTNRAGVLKIADLT